MSIAAALLKELTVFEHTRVTALKDQEAVTERGSVFAKDIVVATHFPFVNVPGFCTCGGTKTENAKLCARLAHAYADATCPKITVYTGSAIGGAAVAFANADIRLAWPGAVISALEPETAVEFFWHDKLKGAENLEKRRAELAEEYAETEASPYAAANASMVEDIVDPANIRSVLIASLEMLASKRVSRLPKKHTN